MFTEIPQHVILPKMKWRRLCESDCLVQGIEVCVCVWMGAGEPTTPQQTPLPTVQPNQRGYSFKKVKHLKPRLLVCKILDVDLKA